jgi:hypothetical protein
MTTRFAAVTTVRSTLARRRSARREQLRLERELAAYSTPRERDELMAILARHTAEQIAPVERVLRNLPPAR